MFKDNYLIFRPVFAAYTIKVRTIDKQKYDLTLKDIYVKIFLLFFSNKKTNKLNNLIFKNKKIGQP